MRSIFGPDGLIAKAHPEYEHRPGQIEMAEAVLRAFEQKRHLIVEAGTGTGKTLAYLVPAVAAACGSGARVVISTGTKNLQEQLMDKDIPFLQDILPAKFRAALMKGRNNYACLHRIKRAETSPMLEGMEQIDQFDEVFRWVAQDSTPAIAQNCRICLRIFLSGVTSMRVQTPAWASNARTTNRVSSPACASEPSTPTSSW